MPSFHKIILLVGRRKCGKTTFAKQMLKKRKRVLVLDTFDHPSYRDHITVPANKISNKIKQVGNFRCFDQNPVETLDTIFKTMYDITLVMEDAVKYLDSNVPKTIKAGFIDSRNRGLDILIMFHSLADIPPYLCRMYNDMILFKTDENIKNSKDKFSNFYTIEQAHQALQKDKNPHAKKIISLNE